MASVSTEEEEQPPEWILALARDDAIFAQRLAAVAALGQTNSAQAVAILEDIAREDEGRSPRAAQALGSMHPAVASPALVRLARDQEVDFFVSEAAIGALGELGCELELLELALDAEVFAHRWRGDDLLQAAVQTLIEMGRTDDVIPILASLVRGPRSLHGHGDWLAELLARLGRAEDLLTIARGSNFSSARVAVTGLARLQRSAALLALVEDTEVQLQVRLDAVHAAAELGRLGDLVALARRPVDEDADRDWFWVHSTIIGMATSGRLDYVVALARDAAVDRRTRGVAVSAMASAGESGVTHLLGLAQDAEVDPWVRGCVIARLGKAHQAPEDLRDLIWAPSVEPWLRFGAAQAVLHQAEKAATVLRDLATASAEDPSLPAAALAGLAERATTGVLSALTAITQNSEADETTRTNAITALDRSWRSRGVLVQMATDAAAPIEVRIQALASLKEFGPEKRWVNALAQLAHDAGSDVRVRTGAIAALGSLATLKALPEVVGLAQDAAERIEVRSSALAALGELGPTGPVSVLVELARDSGTTTPVRAAAITALAAVGDSTAPVLYRLYQDPDVEKEIHESAKAALIDLERLK